LTSLQLSDCSWRLQYEQRVNATTDPKYRNLTVLYFAGYKKVEDRYKIAEIENAADAVVWCCDEEPGFRPTRPQDRSFVGNIVQVMMPDARHMRLADLNTDS
jgi:hypothetical protein